MKISTSKIKKEHIALTIIILLQTLTIILLYRFCKTFNDTDEFYSYGLANSYKRPFLHLFTYNSDDNVSQDDFTAPLWLTGNDFKYYMRTNSDTSFKYDSVFYNQTRDTIPPLYYCILHTICSIRKDHFSWYYALGINIICLIITQIFTYLLAAKVTRSKFVALLVVTFWGFSLGGISCFIFLRMYAMLTMFGVIYAYLSIKLHTTPKPGIKDYIYIALIAFLGAMTHHNFLIFSFFLTAFSCLFLLLQRAFKKFFSYGISALIGIALSFAVFPATIDHLSIEMPWTDSLPFSTSLRFFTITLKLSITGSYFFPTSWLIYFVAIIIPLIAFSIPIIFLFRKTAFVQSAPGKIKNGIKTTWGKLTDPHKMEPGALILLFTSFAFLCVIAKKVYFLDLLDNSIRYLYILIPCAKTVIFGLASLVIRKFKKEKLRNVISVVCSIALAGSLIYQHYAQDPVYLYHKEKQGTPVTEYTKDMDCILLVSERRNLQCCSLMVEDANDVLCSSASSKFQTYPDVLAEYDKIFDKQQPFMLLLDTSKYFDDETLEKIKNKKENANTENGNTVYSLENSSNYDFIDYDNIDEMQKESGIIKYLEDYSGYKAELCTKERSCMVQISAYLFTPQK